MADWHRIAEAIANLLHAGGDLDDIAVLLRAHPDLSGERADV